jgi:hypothetical protein
MLLIESSRAYGRGCLLGVAAYVRSHGRWSVLHIERGLTENVPKFLRSWKGDGVIARIENEKIAKAVADLGMPAVDLRGSHRPANGAMPVGPTLSAARNTSRPPPLPRSTTVSPGRKPHRPISQFPLARIRR